TSCGTSCHSDNSGCNYRACTKCCKEYLRSAEPNYGGLLLGEHRASANSYSRLSGSARCPEPKRLVEIETPRLRRLVHASSKPRSFKQVTESSDSPPERA